MDVPHRNAIGSEEMNILITGAQLSNKGAQSMLFVVTDEMKKRFPDAEIYFATDKDYDESIYKFHKFPMTKNGLAIAVGGKGSFEAYVKAIGKDVKETFAGNNHKIGQFLYVKRNFSQMDMLIDVSGFSLGEKWGRVTHEMYMNRLELAKRYKIPVYLMPQSFGPFNYIDDMKDIMDRMKDLLNYPRIVFAREEEGLEYLQRDFNLQNVRLSIDLVLQNKEIDWNNVYTKKTSIDVPKVNGDKTVGIVPNMQCIKHGNEETIIELYKSIIDKLLADGYTVYTFRHSKNDIELCGKIKDLYVNDQRVVIEGREFSCMEYSEYIKQFQFLICSRYHGIVHAYRHGIPCIALGWAVKYKELAKCVGQGKYSFDILQDRIDVDSIIDCVLDMEKEYKGNTEIIRKNMEMIQLNNCFDQVEKDFRDCGRCK